MDNGYQLQSMRQPSTNRKHTFKTQDRKTLSAIPFFGGVHICILCNLFFFHICYIPSLVVLFFNLFHRVLQSCHSVPIPGIFPWTNRQLVVCRCQAKGLFSQTYKSWAQYVKKAKLFGRGSGGAPYLLKRPCAKHSGTSALSLGFRTKVHL